MTSIATPALVVDDLPADATTWAELDFAGGPVRSTLDFEGDTDWVAVDVQAGGVYRFDLTGQGGRHARVQDTVMRLFDADGNEIAFDDDSGKGLNSRITFTAAETGTIFVAAGAFAPEDTGGWKLKGRIVSEPVAGDDHADTVGDAATPLAMDAMATGEIEVDGDVDVFRFDAEAGREYDLTVRAGDSGYSLADSVVRILDAEGNEIAFNDDNEWGGLDSHISFVPAEAGPYFVEVSSFGGLGTGDYAVELWDFGAPDDHGDMPERASELNRRGKATGEIEEGGDVDVFALDVDAGGTYRVDVGGKGRDKLNDPVVRLLDADGNEIAMDDDGGRGLNSRLTFTAEETGRVFVEVSGFDPEETGAYKVKTKAIAPGDDFGETPETAGTIDPWVGVRGGTIETDGDRDWLSFEALAGDAFEISVNGADYGIGTLADPVLTIYDAEGEVVAYDDDGSGGLDPLLWFEAPADGTYYAEVSSYGDAGTGTYEVWMYQDTYAYDDDYTYDDGYFGW